jgi:hypothetical protein
LEEFLGPHTGQYGFHLVWGPKNGVKKVFGNVDPSKLLIGNLVYDFWAAYLYLKCLHAFCGLHILRELVLYSAPKLFAIFGDFFCELKYDFYVYFIFIFIFFRKLYINSVNQFFRAC